MIVAENLTKRFGDTVAVDDVSFEAHPGQVVGYLGHNGAGKTTTLRMLLGHVRPSSGRSTILGKPFHQLDRPLSKVGVLFDSGIHPGRSARNHLRVTAALGGIAVDADRIEFLLDLVGLENDADRRAGGFSQGMRQRLGLATALIADPEVIILDEPASGLDPEGIRWLRSLLRKLADDGRTVLISSHQLAEVAQTVDHVLVMDRGVLIKSSSLRELKRDVGSEVIVRSPGAEVLADELRSAGIATSAVKGDELRARDVPPRVISELAAKSGVPVWEVRGEEPSLEEAFFDLTERGRNGERPQDDGDGANGDPPDEPEGGAGYDAGDPLAEAEAEVDRDLSRLPKLTRGRVVAVLAHSEGLGRTTVSYLLADVLADGLDARTLAVALSCDRERLAMPVATDRRSALNLSDVLADLDGFDEAARISPYVSVAKSGAHTLCGPRRATELDAVTPEQVDGLLTFAAGFYEVVVLDVGRLRESTLRAVLRRADQVLLLGVPSKGDPLADDDGVLAAIESERSERATLVFNRVEPKRAEGFARQSSRGGHALLPHDRELIRALDAGDFSLAQVERTTRVALKRLGLLVAEGLR